MEGNKRKQKGTLEPAKRRDGEEFIQVKNTVVEKSGVSS
jgi:hypothetical protein